MESDDEEYPGAGDLEHASNDDEVMAYAFEEEFGIPGEEMSVPTAGVSASVAAADTQREREPSAYEQERGSELTHLTSPILEDASMDQCPADDDPIHDITFEAHTKFRVPGHHGPDGAGTDVEIRILAPGPRKRIAIDLRHQTLLPIAAMIENVEREKLVVKGRASALPSCAATNTGLWVDRYSPRSFMDLLSDERINRQVLHWVKAWEGHVFGKRKRTSGALEDTFGARARNDRPERQLLLLSGPPGLGKTTLAKVVAKHAGYELMEINASDDRSAKVLKQRIKDATEVQPVFGTRKPVLVVLDEIDGAMGGGEGSSAISELLRLATHNNESKGAVTEKIGQRAKSKSGDGLHRPVICICNDLYAPALRPLREVAEVIQFKPGRDAALVFRLKTVCNKEGLKADDHTLNKLVQMADGDIRACLNTLQFARMRSEELTYEALLTMPIGNKDVAKGALDLWKQVFILPSPGVAPRAQTKKPSRYRVGPGSAEFHNPRQEELFNALNRADIGRIIDGLHENYLTVGYADPLLSRTAEAAEWLSLHQYRTHMQYTQGHFALMAYGDFSVLGVQHSCSVAFPKEQLRFPKAAAEQRAKQREGSQLLASWRASMPSMTASRYNASALVTDLVSPLLSLLSPPFRNTASHILNTEEKELLTSLVDNMISFGLRLRHSHHSDASHALTLDPPLSKLLPGHSYLDGPESAGDLARQLPSHIRQLLHAELQRESLRRHVVTQPRLTTPTTASQPMAALSAADAARSIKAPATNLNAPTSRDMFGRPVGDPSRKRMLCRETSVTTSASANKPANAVRFKFQEGVTDAVRRTVRVQDLL